MEIVVNDRSQTRPAGSTVADLVRSLGLPGTRVAVEVNGSLVRRADHETAILHDGDRVEVVTLVGGG